MKKNILGIMVCFITCFANAMMDSHSDDSGFEQGEIMDLEMGGYESAEYESVECEGADDESDQEFSPHRITNLIYNKRNIRDKYDRAHLFLMVQELYERNRSRYDELISEVMPVRGHRIRPRSNQIDKLYGGLMQLKQNISTTNALLQEQIAGDNEQARIDTYRWRCDYCRECCFGVLGLAVGIFGTSLITVFIE